MIATVTPVPLMASVCQARSAPMRNTFQGSGSDWALRSAGSNVASTHRRQRSWRIMATSGRPARARRVSALPSTASPFKIQKERTLLTRPAADSAARKERTPAWLCAALACRRPATCWGSATCPRKDKSAWSLSSTMKRCSSPGAAPNTRFSRPGSTRLAMSSGSAGTGAFGSGIGSWAASTAPCKRLARTRTRRTLAASQSLPGTLLTSLLTD